MAGTIEPELPTYLTGKLKSGGQDLPIVGLKDGVASCIYLHEGVIVEVDIKEEMLVTTSHTIYLEKGAVIDGVPNNKVYIGGFNDLEMTLDNVTDGIATCVYFSGSELKTITVDASVLIPLA
jgi:hypothetical protein